MKLSIITINRNNKQGLLKTMDSILSGQTFTDFEYIVIDGASDDGSLEVIESHKDRLAYWCSEKDRGIYHAMNKGIAQAKGEYLLFMNSGDCLVKDCLWKVFDLEKSHSADFVYGNSLNCYSDGQKRVSKPAHPLTFLDLYLGALCHQSMFIRRSLFFDCLYNEQLKIVSDWEFCIKHMILANSSLFYVDIDICEYDMTGISSNPNYEAIQKAERVTVLHRLIPQRILEDYVNLALIKDIKEDEFLSTVIDIKATRTFKRFLVKVDLFLYRLYCLFRNKHKDRV